MLNQTQIDQLSAQEYTYFLSDEQEFCNDPHTIGYQWIQDSKRLENLGDITNMFTS